jgi:hypothetical protein
MLANPFPLRFQNDRRRLNNPSMQLSLSPQHGSRIIRDI